MIHSLILGWLSARLNSAKYFQSENGNIAIVAALGSVGLFGAAGFAMDMAKIQSTHTDLQTIADNSALASAKEILVSNSKGTVEAAAKTLIKSGIAEIFHSEDVKIEQSVEADLSNRRVHVALTMQQDSLFGSIFGLNKTTVSVAADAKISGGDKLCVLSLETSASDSIALTDSAKITATECDVQANSNSTSAITAWNGSWIKSAATCSVGGYQGGTTNFVPQVITDCPILKDPLANRPIPAVVAKACDYTNLQVNGGASVLSPGVYCGGLNISTGANVTFLPGIYVMRDGIFQASNGSRLYGKGAGFYLDGATSTFKFNTQSSVELYAPLDGEMAGLLFFSDRKSTDRIQQINSEFAHQLVGTIYLPNDIFQIAANTPVADQSAYTAIIARRIILNQSPNLVVNANYGATDVPVPDGIAQTAGAILIK